MSKDVQRSYWFKRRRYGYGWTPVTWQGWLVVLLFVVGVTAVAFVLLGDVPRNTVPAEAVVFLGFVAVATLVMVGVSLVKGPRPKWRWGSKSDDVPEEDY